MLTAAALLSAELSLHAQENEQQISGAIVPLVGSVRGLGDVLWTADVFLTNPWNEDLEVIITAPTLPGDPFLFFTLSSKETLPLPDVVREAFDAATALTPLRVQTLGPRSVTVNCIIRGTGPDGPVQPQVPPTMYSEPAGGIAQLSGLRIDDDYRTNVGLVNLTDTPVLATLSIQRITGRPLETIALDLPPHSISHRPLGDIFPVVARGSDLTLIAEFSSSGAYAYASVLRNESHAGRFVGP